MIHLLTGWSKDYEPLAQITFPGKALYAKRHGYQINYYIHPNERMAWNRPLQWLSALHSIPEDDWLFFTGCDAVLTNHSIKLEELIDPAKDLIASTDYIDLQGDSFLLRNCLRSRRWLARVLTWEERATNEQEAMSVELSGSPDYHAYWRIMKQVGFGRKNAEKEMNGGDMRVKLLPQHLINAYPMHLYGPGEIGNDGTSWELGCFLAHLPTKSLAFRMEHIPKILIASDPFIDNN